MILPGRIGGIKAGFHRPRGLSNHSSITYHAHSDNVRPSCLASLPQLRWRDQKLQLISYSGFLAMEIQRLHLSCELAPHDFWLQTTLRLWNIDAGIGRGFGANSPVKELTFISTILTL